MRKPDEIERLYLDFDGFFASVEQQANPSLRNRPIGVVPFEGTDRTGVIACSREAKALGVKNVMGIREAKEICPDLILVPQKPDLYRRAHNSLLAEIEAVLPIDAVKSIDELTCRLDDDQRRNPEELAEKLKRRLAHNVGSYITASIGMAANRQLAKIACKEGKRKGPPSAAYGNGLAIWHPAEMPAPLLNVRLEDIPGVGARMYQHLMKVGVVDTKALLELQPKQMRKIWGSVTGERLWYALHGYDIQAPETERGAFGHGRVLPPESRTLPKAYEIARLLLVKAARRLRRAGYYCSGIWLWLAIRDGSWSKKRSLPVVNDDAAVLEGLSALWKQAERELGQVTVFRIGVTLMDLTFATARQLDLLVNDDRSRQRWEHVTNAVDALNARYSKTTVSLGAWSPPAGGNAGGKISYTRIPSSEDFW